MAKEVWAAKEVSFFSYQDVRSWHLRGMMGLIRKPSISSTVNCGHMAANQSARCTAEFVNIGRNVVVALKSGLVETGPTILVAMTLHQ